MLDKTIKIDLEKKGILINTVREFADKRGYVLRERVDEPKHLLVIYNRQPESSFLLSTLEMFGGNSLLPGRIRLESTITETEDQLKLFVKGEVIMKEINYINKRPNKRDALRCEDIFEEFIQKILSI